MLKILEYLDLSFIFGVACILFTAVLWRWWQKPHPKFPPGPKGVPIFGVLPLLGLFPERDFKRWSLQRYGPVMSAKFMFENVVVLNTFGAIHQALVTQSSDFSGRPPIRLYTQVRKGLGLVFVDYHETFRNQKKFAVSVLKQLGMGKKGMENIINDEIDYFFGFLQPKVGEALSFRYLFHDLIGNVICKLVFGRRFDYNDQSVKPMFDSFKETYSDPNDTFKIALLFLFHEIFSKIPPFSTVNQKIIDGEETVMGCIRPIINDHRETFDKNHIRDYIDAYIYEQKYGSDKDFTDRQLEVAVIDLFSAGTETTSAATGWMFLALLHYPEYKAKIVDEVDKACGPSEWPTLAKKTEMPFTSAFIQELHRYLPVGPLSITHVTARDVELGGYMIPKGTKIFPNIWGAHFDPQLWKNPNVFDPYRHLDDEGKFIPSTKIIAFGIGPRFCLGESIARMEIFLVLTRFLQKYDINGTGEPLPALNDGLTSIVHTPKKYEMILNLR